MDHLRFSEFPKTDLLRLLFLRVIILTVTTAEPTAESAVTTALCNCSYSTELE